MLADVVEGLGGVVAGDRILRKHNPKAVVVATPDAWRKLKFLRAVACGIPVVHAEWLHACSRTGTMVPMDGYRIPSGFAITTGKFECLPVQPVRPRRCEFWLGHTCINAM